MPRLAERIRNTQPWCAALLRAPQVSLDFVENEDGLARLRYKAQSVPMMMPWEPGFVIQFPGFTIPRSYSHRTQSMVEDRREQHLILTARRQSGCDIEIEVWCCRGGEACPSAERQCKRATHLPTSGLTTIKTAAGIIPSSGRERRLSPDSPGLGRPWQPTCLPSLLGCCSARTLRWPSTRTRQKDDARVRISVRWRATGCWTCRGHPGTGTGRRRRGQRESILVRGHFKTYTEEAPLFGKLTGTFWVPSHARGDASLGLAEKDYNLLGRENSDAA